MKTFLLVISLTIPTLLAFNSLPSPSFYNQSSGFALWGVLSYFSFAAAPGAKRVSGAAAWLLQGMLLAILAGIVVSYGRTDLPVGITLIGVGLMLGAALVVSAVVPGTITLCGRSLFIAIAVCALMNAAPAFIEAFFPKWVDGLWVSVPWSPDRISGNMRQPNLLATMCAMGAVAVGALLDMGIANATGATIAMLIFSLTVALTGSRVGLAEFALIAVFGLAHKPLRQRTPLVDVADAAAGRQFLGWPAGMVHLQRSVAFTAT